MKTDEISFNEINRLLEMYTAEVESSALKPLAATMYRTHTKNFVRWIEGEFTPGGKLKKQISS